MGVAGLHKFAAVALAGQFRGRVGQRLERKRQLGCNSEGVARTLKAKIFTSKVRTVFLGLYIVLKEVIHRLMEQADIICPVFIAVAFERAVAKISNRIKFPGQGKMNAEAGKIGKT